MFRRVVTGVNDHGKSIVVSDADIEAVDFVTNPNVTYFDVWGADGPVVAPTSGDRPPYFLNHPEPGGFRAKIFIFRPEREQDTTLDSGAIVAEIDAKLPGAMRWIDADGMETTPSVDVGIVLDGSMVLVLDDGVEVPLAAGDVVVQNGTRHTWRNRSDAPATMLFLLVAAESAGT